VTCGMKKLKTTELKNQLLFAAIHRIKSRQQREAFKQPLKKGEAKILIDFKSNIQIGMTCEQKNQQYYNVSYRQLLGIWIQTSERELFFDILSEDLTKDKVFVTFALKIIFERQEFKDLKLDKIYLWSDGARHFRNKYTAALLQNKVNEGLFKSVT
jgi:hypothetical protein